MNRHIFAGLSALLFATTIAACGDDETANCGAGTELVNGACVPITTTDASNGDTTTTTTATDTSGTTGTTDTGTTGTTGTTAQDTSTPLDTSGECTPEEAGKGGVGAACTKDCQCNQSVKNKPLTCYSGPIMEGFSFCSRKADGTLNEGDGVETLKYVSSCFQPAGIARFDDIYVKGCEDVDDCKAVASAYDACGTGDLEYSTSPSTTDCPYWNTTGYVGGSSMVLKKTCIITTTPPYNEEWVVIP